MLMKRRKRVRYLNLCGVSCSRVELFENRGDHIGINSLVDDARHMNRKYVPHPGKLPTHKEALARWVRPAPVRPYTIGEVPYESYIKDALNGDGKFEYAVVPQEGVSHARLVKQLMDSGDIKISAAHTVALGLAGLPWHAEGRATVWAAELFAHRQSSKFSKDPTPVRGKLDRCISKAAFEEISPSVAVNLSALRSLTWGKGLRPSDIFTIWTLVGFALMGMPSPSHKILKAAFSLSRPHDTMTRVGGATFSVSDDPDLNGNQWVHDLPVMTSGRINPLLLEHVQPTAGGQNYAYLELKTISEFTAAWQENAYRGLLASAVRSRNYWKEGGQFSWELSISESNRLFQNESENYDRLRRERLAPLAKILKKTQRLEMRDLADVTSFDDIFVPFSAGSRIQFEHRPIRKSDVQGRPAEGIVLEVTVQRGNAIEIPTRPGQYSSDRTSDRKKRKDWFEVVSGLGRAPDKAELTTRRSEAAKAGWETRRKRPNDHSTLMIPKRPRPGDLV